MEPTRKAAALSAEKRALLEARLLRGVASPTTSLPPAEGSAFVLSAAQESLWFLNRLEPDSAFYVIPQAMRIHGPLDREAFRRSFEQVTHRHDSLRLRIQEHDGKPVPIIAMKDRFQTTEIDLSQLPGEFRLPEANRWISEEARRPFALESEPLLRVAVLRLDSEDHVVLITLHHIVSDLWSFLILFREVSANYRALRRGAALIQEPLALQFGEFACQQRQFLQSDSYRDQIHFWRNTLAEPLPTLELPTDRFRPQSQSFRGHRKYIHLPVTLCEKISRLSQEENATAFVSLAAAFAVLLHRYSAQEDLLIGSPLGGRSRLDTEALIGYFVNPLALRFNLAGDPTFRDFLRRTRTKVFEAFANQDVPFDRLVDELRLYRSPDRNPVFQVMFQFQPMPEPRLQLDGTSTELIELETGTSKLDLIFTLNESEDGSGWVGHLEYNTDLFEGGTVERMLGHYGCLLESVVADPGQPISRLNLLTQAERDLLLVTWNRTRSEYPREQTIAQLFRAQAQRTPGAIALVFGSLQWTYGQLDERSDHLAALLQEQGVERGDRVAVALERSPELIMTLLAILKAGAAYVPLDWLLPEERLRYLVEETKPKLLVSDLDLPIALSRIDPRTLTTGSLRPRPVEGSSEDLAYILFTSGSTGQPKGVAVPQRGVVRLVCGNDFMRFGPEEVFLQFAPISFDASTLEIWGSLLHGARLVIHPPGLPSLQELGNFLLQQGVTTLWLTAGLFHQMVEHQIDSLRGLKQLLAGGDVLSVPHVLRVLRELPGCQLINGYGPTENTTFTCTYSVPHDWPGHSSVPIGRPIAQTSVYILDEHGQLAPIGVPGELLTGGDGLALGYWNRPELTREKFIEHPLADGGRLYRTGDQARYRSDGTIEFLGRMDQQVKIRGFRVELEEIEAALVTHERVRQACVRALDHDGDKSLAAYVTAAGTIDPAELRAHLERTLPRYMIPAHFIFLDQFPLNANGKIDRARLPQPEKASTATNERTPARTPLEQKLIDVWSQVLGHQHLGIHDNFFQLGGHSLLATQIASRASRVCGVDLSLRQILEFPTIASLAAEVERSVAKPKSDRPTLTRRARPGANVPSPSPTQVP